MAATRLFVESVKKGLGAFADLVMPPACLACKTPVATALSLCPDCWASLPVIGDCCCIQCGVPLPTEWQTESHCLECIRKPPPFTQSRAPYAYDGAARQIMLGFKNGRAAWSPVMARAMARMAPEWIAPGRILLPVPLHRWRLARRGYNQALLLAQQLRDMGGATLGRDWLLRIRNTRTTRGMTRSQRQRNTAGAFRVHPAAASRLRDADITLIDDVMTTGATAAACARTLLRAGARQVDVLTYARVAAVPHAPYLDMDPIWENHDQS